MFYQTKHDGNISTRNNCIIELLLNQ